MMRVADLIMKRLADEGLRHMFLLPGGGAMHLNDALACEKRITPIPCHHEQACGISAEAYGRTGNPNSPGFGVALVTTGPGATNLITPVTGAWIDSVPLLVISGQVKLKDRLNGMPLRQCGVQEVDIIPMVSGITKYAATVEDPKSIYEHLDKALLLMRSGRPGPVWIEVPLDVQGAHVDISTLSSLTHFKYSPPPPIDRDQIYKIVSALKSSVRPLILAGHGVRLSGSSKDFLDLIDQLQVPVVCTWNAIDLISSDHSLYVGTPGAVALRAPNFAIQNCDLLISIGCRLDNVLTAYNQSNFAASAFKIIVDIDKSELDKDGVIADEKVHADAADFIRAFADIASSSFNPCHSAWNSQCLTWKDRYSAQNEKRNLDPEKISHYQLVNHLSTLLPEHTLIVTGSSGLAVESFYSTFASKVGQRIFLTSGLGSMGYGLSAAIGGCLGNEKQTTILIEGDGSFMLNLQELATLKSCRLPIKAIIFDNDGYASIRNTQQNYFHSRYIASGSNSGLEIPDLSSVVKSFGLMSVVLSSPKTLYHDLYDFIHSPQLSVCIVKLCSSEVLSPKVTAMPQPDGTIVSMPLEDMTPLLDYSILESEMINDLRPISLKVRH